MRQNGYINTKINSDNHPLAIPIHAQQLEQWFSLAERHINNQTSYPQQDASLPSLAFIARFGMRSINDVLLFLNSPAGKTERAIILKEIMHEKKLEQAVLQEGYDAARREKIMLAFLFACLLYQRAAKADRLNKILDFLIQNQVKKMQDKLKKQSTNQLSEETILLQAQTDVFTTQIRFLDDMLQSIHQLISQKESELQTLNEEITVLEGHRQALARAQQHTHTTIDHLAYIEKGLNDQNDLDRHIHTLETELQHMGEQTAHQLEGAPEIPFNNAMQKVYHTQLLINALHHIKECAQGNHLYFDQDGNRVTHYHQAAFAMPHEIHQHHFGPYHDQPRHQKKIVKDELGRYYLLNADEHIEDIKRSEQSQDRLKNAREGYHQFVQQYGTLPYQLTHTHQLQCEKVDALTTRMQLRRNELQEELTVLHNQKNQIASDRAYCVQQYEQCLIQTGNTNTLSDTQTPVPLQTMPLPEKPTPVRKSTSKKSQTPQLTAIPSSYQRIILSMHPELRDPIQTQALRKMLENVQNQKANSVRKHLNQLDTIPANEPVPMALQKALHEGLMEPGIQEHITKNSPWYRILHPMPV